MRRREAFFVRMENRPQKNLMQSDYLLGVYDEHRIGALRFKESLDRPFLNDNREMAAPPYRSGNWNMPAFNWKKMILSKIPII